MTARGCGIRDIAVMISVNIGKVLSTISSSVYEIAPKKSYYERLEVDEFWTYVYRRNLKSGSSMLMTVLRVRLSLMSGASVT